MVEQAFLCTCITATKTTGINLSILNHSVLHTGILMGVMPAVAIPTTLASIPHSPQYSCPMPLLPGPSW
jgi:hypothetical protein